MIENTAMETMLSFPAATLAALHRALAEGRTPDEAAESLRHLGYDTGRGFYQALGESMRASGIDPSGVDPERFWEQFGEFFARLGWGRLAFERVHPGVGALTAGDWVEAEVDGEAMHPSCHFSTGMLADMLGRVAGRELAVLEVECRSRGDSRCRFLVGGLEALERVYGYIREGGSVADSLSALS